MNSRPASAQISACSDSACPASSDEIAPRRSVSSRTPSRSIPARTSIERHLDLGEDALEAEVGELRALALGQIPDEPGLLARVLGLGLLLGGGPERELAVVGLLVLGGGGLADREPLVGGELAELVGPPGRVDQVGGEHRVVGEVEGAGGQRAEQPARSLLAERLRVVGDERMGRERVADLLRRGRVADEQALAVIGGPALGASQRERDLALLQVSQRPLLGLELDPLLGDATGDATLPLVLEALDHLAQLELGGDLAQPRDVSLAVHQLSEVELDLDVVARHRQLLRDPRVVGELGQVLLPLGTGDLVDVVEHALDRAELLEQLRGRLLADPGDAGDVVGGVALEPDQVGDELRRDPVALDHRLGVVDLRVGHAAGGRHHPDPVTDQLVGVAVAGDDHHRDVLVARLLDERGDHVVGLEALDRDVGEAEGIGERREVRPLLLEQVGARRALRLVGLVDLLAARRAGVPGNRHRARAEVGEDLDHHRREPVDRIRGPSVGGRDRLGQGEEGPVGEAVSVDQEELAFVGGAVFCGRRHGTDHRTGAQSFPRLCVVGR